MAQWITLAIVVVVAAVGGLYGADWLVDRFFSENGENTEQTNTEQVGSDPAVADSSIEVDPSAAVPQSATDSNEISSPPDSGSSSATQSQAFSTLSQSEEFEEFTEDFIEIEPTIEPRLDGQPPAISSIPQTSARFRDPSTPPPSGPSASSSSVNASSDEEPASPAIPGLW